LKLESPNLPPHTVIDLERIIASVKWRESTTYPPDMQHAYILKNDVPVVFDALKRAINEYGFLDEFAGQPHTYLVIGSYKYWAYDTVLNREHVQLTLDRQTKGGIR